jgi:hypothetical protein
MRVQLTARDRRLLGLCQPERTATPSCRQMPRQLIEPAGAQRNPAGPALADHQAGFAAKGGGRP